MPDDLKSNFRYYAIVAVLTLATFVLGLVLLAKIAPAQTQSTSVAPEKGPAL